MERERGTEHALRAFHSLFQSQKKKHALKIYQKFGRVSACASRKFYSFIYIFSNVWLKPSEIGKVQSSRSLSILPEIWGAFHSTKTSRLNFRQFPVANRAAFSKISTKARGQPRVIYPNFQKPFS